MPKLIKVSVSLHVFPRLSCIISIYSVINIMCLDSITLKKLVLLTSSKALSQGKYEPASLKKLLKVQSSQDLSLRNGLAGEQLDLLAFLKATEFPGLLGNQVFRAMDKDQDGWIDGKDFLAGVEALMGRSQEQTAEFLFTVLDSGLQGYLSVADMRASLPFALKCTHCGCSKYPAFVQACQEAFKGSAEMEFERFLECVWEELSLISYLKVAIVTGLPEILQNWFDFGHIPCCHSSSRLTNTVHPLLLNGRKYYASLDRGALLCYNSIVCSHLVTAVLLQDVYLEEKPGNGFSLGNLNYNYDFGTESGEERTWWVERISEIINKHSTLADSDLELVGSGSYGSVFKACNKETGTISACKVVSKSLITRKMELSVWMEIAALRSLQHPNIVTLYEVYETKAEIVIVTEYLANGTLLNWLQVNNFKATEVQVKSVAVDLASALLAMHQLGIVHRDIKLENVMVASTYPALHVKLIDLGLCCFLGPNQQAEEPVGTLKYVAPEVLAKLRYREKVDCWSFGVLLYVLFRGTMPFGGKTDEEIVLSVLKRRLSFSSAHWSAVSPLAVLAFSRLIIRNPTSRLSISDFLHCDWLLA